MSQSTLNNHRKRAGISMTELSEYTAIPRRTLYRYFEDPSLMTVSRLRAIGEVLGLTNEQVGEIATGKERK